MNNAISYLIEPFLTQYFLIDSVCKNFISDSERRTIFNELAKVFCVPADSRTQQYYDASNSRLFSEITDYASYERLSRTIEFAEMTGQDIALTMTDRMILAQKKEAMYIKSTIFKHDKNLTRDTVADILLETAMNGNIDAMTTLSYMEYHGICVTKDIKNAAKRILLCAKWNSLFGNLMCITYNCGDTDSRYDTLYTILRSSNQREVFNYICSCHSYRRECTRSSTARIIEKAFGLSIVNRSIYDPIFANVAYSELISPEDKEKLLLNKKKEAIVSLSEIPFDVGRKPDLVFQEPKAKETTLDRPSELCEIFSSISLAVNGRMDLYRPLLIAGDDSYIASMYAAALKKGFGETNRVIDIDASTLSMQDFAGSKENFILRGLSETKNTHTVFLVKNCDEIGDRELDELIKLTDYSYRRKFKLLEPTVSLDLSDVILILFASEINNSVRRLSAECETVRTIGISDDEKNSVISSLFKKRSTVFGCDRISMDSECVEYLHPFGTEQIIRIIDGALKKAVYENNCCITADVLRLVSQQQNINRKKREFGYIGGASGEKN